MKRFAISILISLVVTTVFAQGFDNVPKEKTFEVGYKYLYSKTYNDLPSGAPVFVFDYAWQLSGFNGKPAAFISVPLGYARFSGNGTTKDATLIYYGWTVRHNLSKDKKWVPFFSYNLLLNQLKFAGIDGRDIGHETKFDFGYDVKLSEKVKLLLKLEYSMTFIPQFGQKHSDGFKGIAFKTGIRF